MQTVSFQLPEKPKRARWFNFLAHLAKGFDINGTMVPAVKMITKGKWITRPCPCCKSPNGFLFKDMRPSTNNVILVCIRCKRGFLREKEPK